jgi:hypothetical protein
MYKSAREIELKYLVDAETFHRLKAAMAPHDIADAGHDHFWDLKYPGVVAFLRHRERPKELTIKIEDGQGVSNRIEVNLPLERDVRMVGLFKTFGAPDFSIFKAYFVWHSRELEISMYHVDVLDQYFVEVEATDLAKCEDAMNHLIASVPGNYTRQDKSLFSLVKEKKAKEAEERASSFSKSRR